MLYLARTDTDVHMEFPYCGEPEEAAEAGEGGNHVRQT